MPSNSSHSGPKITISVSPLELRYADLLAQRANRSRSGYASWIFRVHLREQARVLEADNNAKKKQAP